MHLLVAEQSLVFPQLLPQHEELVPDTFLCPSLIPEHEVTTKRILIFNLRSYSVDLLYLFFVSCIFAWAVNYVFYFKVKFRLGFLNLSILFLLYFLNVTVLPLLKRKKVSLCDSTSGHKMGKIF